jgi:HEAT repeat protein
VSESVPAMSLESEMKNRPMILAVLARFALGATVMLATGFGTQSQERATGMPRVEHARVEQRAVNGSLAADVKTWAEQSVDPRWIGYAVPEIASDREVCCNSRGDSWGNHDCGVCRLEGSDHGLNMTTRGEKGANGDAGGTVKLEGPRNLVILLRAEGKRTMRIRVLSEDCAVDAGGLPVAWITDVKPAQSVALLREFVRSEDFEERGRGRDANQVSQGALTAIALHADESADRAMESFVHPDQREELRRLAAFWLGESRGAAGFATLQKMAKGDPSADVRAHVAFALSVSREPSALDEMIRMAKDDENSHVREQALFWLAQKAGNKAVGAITGAIDNDPDTEVKKKAVFALSQLPKDVGVPKLIEVAQTNRNLAVRKQAMFWLGQSNDPRALAFFEKILSQ